ncbi:MAG: hypothetical protein A2X94_13215 [Bdellovibrionales bacterium GWB1_55_8]|nr:MAG: hypothetical protein A2X94_13215 [Bdellovibrionales bacterium GWB1_55_8]
MKAKHSTQTQRSRDDYAGNRVSQGSLNLANLLVENSSHKFVPDEFGTGSLAQKVDRVSGAAENFSYRADQKLTSYSRDGMQAEYFYDALGRRVAKKITKGAEPVFTQSYVYLGEEDKILLGKSGDGEITLYLDGQGIDEHLGEVSSRGAKAYATDHLGSVLNGEAAGAARAFGAWGENLNATAPEISASSAPVAYGYTGRQLDPESQSYYYRARTYLPEVGRFAQPDPIGFEGGDTNLYRYVLNDPLSFVDPDGLRYRICSRPLQGLTAQYGPVRHDYLEFDDGTTFSFGPAPGEKYINVISSNLTEDGTRASCGSYSSDSSRDREIKLRALNNFSKRYNVFKYNCQDFVLDSIR